MIAWVEKVESWSVNLPTRLKACLRLKNLALSSKTLKQDMARHAIQYTNKEVTELDRSYTLPCQKANFKSCEGCPETICDKKHYLSMDPQLIHA